MNNVDAVLNRLKVIESLFSRQILDSNLWSNEVSISWPKYEAINKKFIYAREYELILRKRQYSFLFSDNSLIQCYYLFDKPGKTANIKQIKLCYYPFPVHLKEKMEDYEYYFEEAEDDIIKQYYFDTYLCMSEEFGFNIDSQISSAKAHFKNKYGYSWEGNTFRGIMFDEVYEQTNFSHFRMDYDADVKTHHKCELQFGAIKNIRFPLDRILDPLLFFDIIFRSFFKDIYSSLITKNYEREFSFGKSKSTLIPGFMENNIYKTLK